MENTNINQLEEQVVASVDSQLTKPVLTHTGQVKWFNNRLGYGFIKVISEGANNNEDIFVHQSNISPNVSEWRSLRQGEYVSFQISDDDGTIQAVHVMGVNGGPLLVDATAETRTRNMDRPDESTDSVEKIHHPKQNRGVRRPRHNNRNHDSNRTSNTEIK